MSEPEVSAGVNLNLSPDVTSRAAAMTPEAARAELHKMRTDPESDFNVTWRDGHLKACELAWALEARAHTPPARVPVPLPPDHQSSRDLKQKHKAMLADLAGWQDGTYQPDHMTELDRQIREAEAREAAAHPVHTPSAPSVTETFSWQDVENVLPRSWLQPQRDRFTGAARAMGLSPREGAELNAVLQTAVMSGSVDLARDPDDLTTLDLDVLWGPKAEENITIVNRYLAKLHRHSPEDELEVRRIVNQDARVANHVLALARRRA